MKAVLAFAAVLLAVQAARADDTISSGVLVTRLGVDTLSVEKFERFADHMHGKVVRRVPRTTVFEYVVTLRADGTPDHAAFSFGPPPGVSGVPRTIFVRTTPDSVYAGEQRDTLVMRSWPLPHAFLSMPDSYALFELWLAGFRKSGADTAVVNLVGPVGGATGRFHVKKGGNDTVYAQLPPGPFTLVADASGRLTRLDGRSSTIKHTLSRATTADMDAIAKRFAADDARGHAYGPAVSPRDTLRVRIGVADFMVDYGRPSKRGRVIFDHGVLGDTLWRTGANAATQFSTDRDLVMGTQTLKAGKYTLWTRVSGASYTLIFNSQTGQWGTEHDPARDVLQVALARAVMKTPIETFTIGIATVPNDTRSGVLHLRWDTTDLSLRFAVK
jgi:hypothetical protein